MPDPVVIIGAGPAGLAAGACLARRGIALRLLDRGGRPGGAYAGMFGGITLASPTSLNGLPGLALTTAGPYTRATEYHDYLVRYAEHHRLSIEEATVERVEPRGRGFRVGFGGGSIDAGAVVVATGMWDFPVAPELAGEASVPVIHARAFRGPEAHAAERVLVVGGGASAVEIAEILGRAGRRVWVAARSGIKFAPQKVLGVDVHRWVAGIERLPTWLARRHCEEGPTLPATDHGFAALRRSGAISVRPAVVRCDGAEVRFREGRPATVDLVILATGFRFDAPFIPAEVARAPAGHLQASHGESVSWPGLFVLGAPCAVGLDSEFLRGVARDADPVADRIDAWLGS